MITAVCVIHSICADPPTPSHAARSTAPCTNRLLRLAAATRGGSPGQAHVCKHRAQSSQILEGPALCYVIQLCRKRTLKICMHAAGYDTATLKTRAGSCSIAQAVCMKQQMQKLACGDYDDRTVLQVLLGIAGCSKLWQRPLAIPAAPATLRSASYCLQPRLPNTDNMNGPVRG
jgi:hypothetical protein